MEQGTLQRAISATRAAETSIYKARETAWTALCRARLLEGADSFVAKLAEDNGKLRQAQDLVEKAIRLLREVELQ